MVRRTPRSTLFPYTTLFRSSSTQRMARSSSTITTRATSVMALLQRNQQSEFGMPGAGVAFDQALVLVQDRLGDGEPQAAALGATRHHGVEEGLAQHLGHPGAVVDDGHLADQAVALGPLGALASRPGA